ncbi:MAG: branched-chain amino acid ABC transporter ATP-binding protein [Deltaproteobacteria bacterium HGW-Deltaproteobacteria-12]|jgi:branched-chain amino acid transport system ATP-binding protein|nr:MAG: branched-chain amino acid ABC transporter ATP-binding protein [Deltaproteobacteria bacterium HGW-Deltaproteobacteria-12]
MLEVKNLNVFYGKLQILWDLSVQIGNESVGLFGPNGAGKTTLINTILGLVKPVSGEITLDGESLAKMETDKIIKLGIAVVPQDRELFPLMSVLENLRTGSAYIPRAKKKYKERLEYIFTLFPILKERLDQPAGSMSGGQQRMVAIARALMADPKVLILDEPSGGLQPSIVTEVFHRLKEIKKDVSILVTEQNVRQALKAIDRGYILEDGKIAMADTAQNLAGNDHIRKSYLGI